MKRFMLVVTAVALVTGCVPRSTGATEVGVHVNKITGVEDRVYPPGGTYFFMPFLTEWYVFPIRTQALEMVLDNAKGDRSEKDDVEFKTRDGNDVALDVTVLYRIDPTKVVHILTRVARNPV